MKVLLFGKASHQGANSAETHLMERFDVISYFGNWGDSFPDQAYSWDGDMIVSYLAPWVIPKKILDRAQFAAINFHPGPPKYPGIGCTNFALYNEEKEYGVTCHHMEPSVDSGELISVHTFPIGATETVFSLTEKCHSAIWELFIEVFDSIEQFSVLPTSSQMWARQPYRRQELNELCKITPDMATEEIVRRVRATTYPGAPGAFFDIGGLRFEYVGDPHSPVALKTNS